MFIKLRGPCKGADILMPSESKSQLCRNYPLNRGLIKHAEASLVTAISLRMLTIPPSRPTCE